MICPYFWEIFFFGFVVPFPAIRGLATCDSRHTSSPNSRTAAHHSERVPDGQCRHSHHQCQKTGGPSTWPWMHHHPCWWHDRQAHWLRQKIQPTQSSAIQEVLRRQWPHPVGSCNKTHFPRHHKASQESRARFPAIYEDWCGSGLPSQAHLLWMYSSVSHFLIWPAPKWLRKPHIVVWFRIYICMTPVLFQTTTTFVLWFQFRVKPQ